MNENFRKLKGANMDIDLATTPGNIVWEQDRCPWNEVEGADIHKCAVKNVSICLYFWGWNISIYYYAVIQMKIP